MLYSPSCVRLASGAVSDFLPSVSDVMVGMGFERPLIVESLVKRKYNDVTATYLLLGRKNEVDDRAVGCFSVTR